MSAELKTGFDISKFERILPGGFTSIPAFSVSSSGTLTCNKNIASKLKQEGSTKISLYISQNGKVIIIKTDDREKELKIRKTGGMIKSSKSLMRLLTKKEINFPARYIAEWDDSLAGFVGRLLEE